MTSIDIVKRVHIGALEDLVQDMGCLALMGGLDPKYEQILIPDCDGAPEVRAICLGPVATISEYVLILAIDQFGDLRYKYTDKAGNFWYLARGEEFLSAITRISPALFASVLIEVVNDSINRVAERDRFRLERFRYTLTHHRF